MLTPGTHIQRHVRQPARNGLHLERPSPYDQLFLIFFSVPKKVTLLSRGLPVKKLQISFAGPLSGLPQ